jgi:hypothetical protein
MMSKYAPLGAYLQRQPEASVVRSFEQIERLLGFGLPTSARRSPRWWENQADGTHVQANVWLGAGWQVFRVDLGGGVVEFRRKRPDRGGLSVEEHGAGFRHRMPLPGTSDLVTFDRGKLGITARRILDDYTLEAGGDVQAALDRALHEARIAARLRLIDGIKRTGPPSTVSSVDLIREDRDAR